jgi:hypothetical protein
MMENSISKNEKADPFAAFFNVDRDANKEILESGDYFQTAEVK